MDAAYTVTSGTLRPRRSCADAPQKPAEIAHVPFQGRLEASGPRYFKSRYLPPLAGARAVIATLACCTRGVTLLPCNGLRAFPFSAAPCIVLLLSQMQQPFTPSTTAVLLPESVSLDTFFSRMLSCFTCLTLPAGGDRGQELHGAERWPFSRQIGSGVHPAHGCKLLGNEVPASFWDGWKD